MSIDDATPGVHVPVRHVPDPLGVNGYRWAVEAIALPDLASDDTRYETDYIQRIEVLTQALVDLHSAYATLAEPYTAVISRVNGLIAGWRTLADSIDLVVGDPDNAEQRELAADAATMRDCARDLETALGLGL